MKMKLLFLIFIISMLSTVSHAYTKEEVSCLALNVYFEARGETDEGQMAVAFVTLNRVRHDRFPDNICQVVYQGRTNEEGIFRCQFSWYCDGLSDEMTNKESMLEAIRIAQLAVLWYKVGEDFTNGATFYHADYVSPYWAESFVKTVTIGSHIFYTFPDT